MAQSTTPTTQIPADGPRTRVEFPGHDPVQVRRVVETLIEDYRLPSDALASGAAANLVTGGLVDEVAAVRHALDVGYPALSCPAWCDGDLSHSVEDVAAEARGEHNTLHRGWNAGGYFSEVRRVPGHVTRPEQGSWDVCCEQQDDPRAEPVPDEVVAVTLESPTVALLPGEARQLAAALVAAADRLDGITLGRVGRRWEATR